ncbi:MAG: HAD-IA family hydrolase [Dongiaceae bacterium]
MKLRDRKILTFDVMGTLIDYETGILDYFRPVMAKAGVDMEEDTFFSHYGRAEDALNKSAPGRPFTKIQPDIYRAVAGDLGLPNDDAHAEGLERSIERWPAFADSVSALKELRKRFRLVAMTNADNRSLSHFSRTLDDPFDDSVTAEDVGTVKPDPQVFAYTRGRSSVHGYGLQDFLHVAQSQFHDIGVAKRLGFAVCWIERRHGKKGSGAQPAVLEVTKPHYHFTTLAQLAEAVERGQ